jgi:hypothetical protein
MATPKKPTLGQDKDHEAGKDHHAHAGYPSAGDVQARLDAAAGLDAQLQLPELPRPDPDGVV